MSKIQEDQILLIAKSNKKLKIALISITVIAVILLCLCIFLASNWEIAYEEVDYEYGQEAETEGDNSSIDQTININEKVEVTLANTIITGAIAIVFLIGVIIIIKELIKRGGKNGKGKTNSEEES